MQIYIAPINFTYRRKMLQVDIGPNKQEDKCFKSKTCIEVKDTTSLNTNTAIFVAAITTLY